MAYKFQLGSFTASGSIKAESGFDAADQNIDNVGTINLDTIGADGNEIDIALAASQANALEIKEGSNDYLVFDTANSIMTASQNIRVDGSKQIQFRQVSEKINSPSAGQLAMEANTSFSIDIGASPHSVFNSSGLELRNVPLHLSGANGKLRYNAGVMAAGRLMVSDGTDFEAVALSGDATLASGGALTIANDAVDNNKLANIARGSIKVGGASNAPTDLDAKTSGQILVGDGTDIVSVAIGGDATLASDGTLSLDAAQTNITSLLATDIKIGEDDETKIDFETPDEIHFYAANAEQVYVADGIFGPQTDSDVDLGSTSVRWKDLYVDSVTVTDNVTIAGNLTVTGTTVEVDAAFVVTSSIQFEGLTPDGNEITLTTADPTADRTITLPDLTGHVPLLSGAVSNANVTAAEFALLDGDSSIGTSTISSGDGFFHNDGGVMKHTDVDTLATFIGNNIAVAVQNVAAAGTLQVGVNYFSDMGSDGEDAVTLPASPSVGQSVKVKAPSDCSEARYITINRAGSQTIDGELSIRLESPFAAVELVYVASNLWRVF